MLMFLSSFSGYKKKVAGKDFQALVTKQDFDNFSEKMKTSLYCFYPHMKYKLMV